MELYVDKYFYNSGFKSFIYSFFQSRSIFKYFYKINNEYFQIREDNNMITKKIFELFGEINSRDPKGGKKEVKSSKKIRKSLNLIIYELRALLFKKGMKHNEIGNNDINPIIIFTFILKKLHEELNINKGKISEKDTDSLKFNYNNK